MTPNSAVPSPSGIEPAAPNSPDDVAFLVNDIVTRAMRYDLDIMSGDYPHMTSEMWRRASLLFWLSSALPALLAAREDAARIDAISEPGTKIRVGMMATENRADPPMRRYAEVCVPGGRNSDCVSVRATLREAIDAARGGARVTDPEIR